MSEHRCPKCERKFEVQRKLAVHHWRSHNEVLPNRQCHCCGSYFQSDHDKKYCSEDCREQSVSFAGQDNPNYRGGPETGTCESCGSTFEYYRSEKQGCYCPSCVKTESWRKTPTVEGENHSQWDGGKKTVTCEVCNANVERWPSEISDVTVCGEPCREQWLSDSFTGSGHPNWKGGGNEAYGSGWNEVRRRALERDEYRCVVCSKSKDEIGRNPDVHHITPVRMFAQSDRHEKEDSHYLENVVSLCISCHRKAEFGNISKEQLRSLALGN